MLLELQELGIKLCMDVLYLINAMVVDLALKVLFGNFETQAVCTIDSFQPLGFL